MILRAAIPAFIIALLSAATPAQARNDDTVECRSSGHKYNECEAPFRHPQLMQQLSESECVANQSWGYNRDTGSIWVSDGCSGIFGDRNGRDSDRGRDDDRADSRDRRDDRDDRSDRGDRDDRRDERRDHSRQEEVVECRSKGYAFSRCDANWRRARLVEQLSGTRCVEGENWGVDNQGLWVDKGCGGNFAGH